MRRLPVVQPFPTGGPEKNRCVGSLDVARTRCTKQATAGRNTGAARTDRAWVRSIAYEVSANRADPFQTSLSWVARTRRELAVFVRPGLPTARPPSPRAAQA